jgi:bifunctional DNA-binding transcriptional regulator/antitoxin component of YhaV-PrlF toxin-antitoxin module
VQRKEVITLKIELDQVKCIKETALTIRGSRRRITVPSEVVDILKLKDGDKLKWVVLNDRTITLSKVK